jgi:hypothetical protein
MTLPTVFWTTFSLCTGQWHKNRSEVKPQVTVMIAQVVVAAFLGKNSGTCLKVGPVIKEGSFWKKTRGGLEMPTLGPWAR